MITEVYAMAKSPADGQQAPGIASMLFPMVVIFAIFYFLIIRPQKRREQKHRNYLSKIQAGDEVILQSGILGKVTGVTDEYVTIEIADRVRVKCLKSAIAGTQKNQESQAA